MKDAIQSQREEVQIVIYDSPLPPKYLTFKKSFLKTLFFIGPVALILIFSLIIFWGLGSQLKYAPKPQFPELINKEQARIIELEGVVKELNASNQNLSQKLSTTPETVAPSEVANLLLIKKPYGMQNLISKNKVALENLGIKFLNGEALLEFYIVNSLQNQRVSGHIVVFQVSKNQLSVYPNVASNALTEGIKYTQGEAFSVTRLRPTKANFSLPSGDSMKFIIYIFTREGDLLLMQETQEYKVERKI